MADNQTIVREKVVVDTTFTLKSASTFSRKMLEIANRASRVASSVEMIGSKSSWQTAATGSKKLADNLGRALRSARALKPLLRNMVGVGGMGGSVGGSTSRSAPRASSPSEWMSSGAPFNRAGVHQVISKNWNKGSYIANDHQTAQRIIGNFARMGVRYRSQPMGAGVRKIIWDTNQGSRPSPFRREPLLLPPHRAVHQMPRSSAERARTQEAQRSAAFDRVQATMRQTLRRSAYSQRQDAQMAQAMAGNGSIRYPSGLRAGTIPLAGTARSQPLWRQSIEQARQWMGSGANAVRRVLAYNMRVPSLSMPSFLQRGRSGGPALSERMVYDYNGLGSSGLPVSRSIGIPRAAKAALDAGLGGLRGKYGGGVVPMNEMDATAKKIISAFDSGGTRSGKKISESMVSAGRRVGSFLGSAIARVGGGTLRTLGLGSGGIAGLVSGLMKLPFRLLGGAKHLAMAPFRAMTKTRHMFWNLAFMGGMGATAGYASLKAMRPAGQREMWQKQFAVIMGQGNTPMEKYQAGQGIAKDRIGWLTKAAERLPATIEETVEAGRLMTVFGIFNQKNFETAGDAALAYNKKLERVAETLGRLKMGAFGLAMRSLRTLGISTDKLKGEGITFKGATPEQDAGTIVKAVMSIWQREVGGLSRNIADSFDVSLSNVGDAFRNMLAKVTENLLSGWKSSFEAIRGAFKYVGDNVALPSSMGAGIGATGVGFSNFITGVATPDGRARLKSNLATLAASSRRQRLGFADSNLEDSGVKNVPGTVTDDDLDKWNKSAWASALEILKNTLNNAFVTGTALLGTEIAKLPAYMVIGFDYFAAGLEKTGKWLEQLLYQTTQSIMHGMLGGGADMVAAMDIPGSGKVVSALRARSLAAQAVTDPSNMARAEFLWDKKDGGLGETVRYDAKTGAYFGINKVPRYTGVGGLAAKGVALASLNSPQGLIANKTGLTGKALYKKEERIISEREAMTRYFAWKLRNDQAFAKNYGASASGSMLNSINPLNFFMGRGVEGSTYENRLQASKDYIDAVGGRQRNILGAAGKSFGFMSEGFGMTGIPGAKAYLNGEYQRQRTAKADAWNYAYSKFGREQLYGTAKGTRRAMEVGENQALYEGRRSVASKKLEMIQKGNSFERMVMLSSPEVLNAEIERRGAAKGRVAAAKNKALNAANTAELAWQRNLSALGISPGLNNENLDSELARDLQSVRKTAYRKEYKRAINDPRTGMSDVARLDYIEQMKGKAQALRDKVTKQEEAEAPLVNVVGGDKLPEIAESAKTSGEKLEKMLGKLDNMIAGLGVLTATLVGLEETV